MKSPDEIRGANSGELSSLDYPCPYCRRVHHIPIQDIRQGVGVTSQLPGIVSRLVKKRSANIALFFDQKLRHLVNQSFLPHLQHDFRIATYGLGQADVWLDSASDVLTEVVNQIAEMPDLIIGVGSGVISDSTKWIATQMGKPFIICGTALSMNGYTSITATISDHGVKKSVLLNPAELVMVDTDLAITAPLRMTQAGLGDLAARSICNADWKLSSLVKGTYFCPLPFEMMTGLFEKCLDIANGIPSHQPESMQVLTEGLLKSGLTMTVLGGESSPSSGAEHVISHFWDWQAHMEGRQHHLHGYQVGIATLISHAIYDLILRIPANNLNSLLSSPRRPVLERILGEIDKRFGNNGEEFKQVAARKYLSDNDYDEYLENLVHRWDEIQAAVSVYITPVTHIHTSYREAGMDISLGAIARSKEDAVDALLFGSRYRIRYTVLDLAWDLGIFPDAVDEVLARAGVLD